MSQKSNTTVKEALTALVADFPNSVVADLLTHFSAEVVIELIQIYSGQAIFIPKVESVWRSYRNKVIQDTLDLRNTLVERKQLANFFGITHQHVAAIYSRERKQRKVSRRTTRLTAKRVYADEMRATFEEVKDVLFGGRK